MWHFGYIHMETLIISRNNHRIHCNTTSKVEQDFTAHVQKTFCNKNKDTTKNMKLNYTYWTFSEESRERFILRCDRTKTGKLTVHLCTTTPAEWRIFLWAVLFVSPVVDGAVRAGLCIYNHVSRLHRTSSTLELSLLKETVREEPHTWGFQIFAFWIPVSNKIIFLIPNGGVVRIICFCLWTYFRSELVFVWLISSQNSWKRIKSHTASIRLTTDTLWTDFVTTPCHEGPGISAICAHQSLDKPAFIVNDLWQDGH